MNTVEPEATPEKTKAKSTTSKAAPHVAKEEAEAPKQGLLATLFAGLDDAHAEASERVERLEAELIEARRDMAAVSALKRIRAGGELPLMSGSGSPPKPARKASGGTSGGGSSSPRGAIPTAVLNALTEAGKKGMTRADLIEKLGIDSDAKAQTSVSNCLSAMKRSGKVLHEGQTYKLNT
jgi:hypothetical protein